MADVMDAGRGGLLAYRTALGVTGQNIANVDSPGYRRREAVMTEVGPGAGVDVVDVRRAFDALMAGRARDAQSDVGAAETALTHLRALEDRLLPGDGGLPDLLDGFFDALDGLSLMPADTGLRHAVLNAGEALAGGVADLAIGLDALAQDVEDETAQAVARVNTLLEGLAEVQADMARSPDAADRNPLLDRRDALLSDLAKQVEVNVTLDDKARATVRLGSGDAGPVLVSMGAAGRLEASPDGRMVARPVGAPATQVGVTPSGGILGGLADAGGAIAQAADDLDAWAATLADEMNRVHAAGRGADGQPGGPLFSLSGWTAEPGALMRGTARAEARVEDAASMPEGPIQLVHDATAGVWQARDPDGAILGTGAREIDLPGLRITLSAGALDGDRITLDRRDDAARHLAFVPETPADIAAAGAIGVGASPDNTGSASLQVRPVPQSGSGMTDLSGVLGPAPVEFLKTGVVGAIPAGAEAAELSAHHRLAAMDLSWPAQADAQTLTLTGGTGTDRFDVPPGMDADAFAAALNAGGLRSDTGKSLSDLGLVAQPNSGGLSLQAVSGELPASATLATDQGPVSGVVVDTAADAASLSVFTREGRQLAGPPLDPDAAAALVTPANGFDPGAVYSAAYLDGAASYAGLGVRADATGSGTMVGLTNLPDEELLVVMSGEGALRLSGEITQGTPAPSIRELRVLDGETGRVGLFDAATGAQLASRTLDTAGTAEFGGLAVTLGAGAATGDRYTLSPLSVGEGDPRNIEALANLRQRDGQNGAGGYGAGFAALQQRAGAQVSAADTRLETARAESESAARAEADLGGVDLDAEAAKLMQHQQAYQANAQVLTVARQLFDTLLQAL